MLINTNLQYLKLHMKLQILFLLLFKYSKAYYLVNLLTKKK